MKLLIFILPLIVFHPFVMADPNNKQLTLTRSTGDIKTLGVSLVKITKQILEPDAKPNIKKANKTRSLKKQEYQISILHKAVVLRKREEVEQLLNSSDGLHLLNLQEPTGNTAMHLAVMLNDRETAELLMRYHPDLSIKNKDGFAVRKLAKMTRNRDMIELFRSNKIGILGKCRDAFKGALKLSQSN